MPFKGVIGEPNLTLKPASLAVLIQIAALIIVFCCVVGLSHFFAVRFTLLILVLMQSVTAVLLAKAAKMAVWWRWIHGVFPVTIYSMLLLPVPNEVYLVGFLITLSIFWTTFRSQVPFFPSRPIVREKVAALLPQDQSLRMIDIGSGLGDLSMYIAKAKQRCQVEGIEIAPMPWCISVLKAWFKQSTASFKLGDYHALDFANYDLVFAYLSPAAMPALWVKAKQEMKKNSLLVSYEFNILNEPASFIIQDVSHPPIYVWKM